MLNLNSKSGKKAQERRSRNISRSGNKDNSVRSFSKFTSAFRRSHSLNNHQTGINRSSRLSNYSNSFGRSYPHTLNTQLIGLSMQSRPFDDAPVYEFRHSVSQDGLLFRPRIRILIVEQVDGKTMSVSNSRSRHRETDEGDDDTENADNRDAVCSVVSAFPLQRASLNFDDLVKWQTKLTTEPTQKAKKFVTAWRSGLSYPKSRMSKMQADIPVAATSTCKTGIKTCTRFFRHFSRATDEELLADLVKKTSLERFLEDTKQFHTVSSVVIKEDLKRKELYNIVHHSDSAEKASVDLKAGDESDMNVVVEINVPPPVHIVHAPEQTLLDKDVAKLWANKNQGHSNEKRK